MRTKRLWILGSILVVLALLVGIFGCAQSTTTTTTSTTSTTTSKTTTTSTTTSTTTTSTTTTGPVAGTINIGMVCWFGWPLGINMIDATKVRINEDNAAGGLLIGGKRYNLNLIYYDSKADPTSTVSATNRLIYQDGVKFIMGDLQLPDLIYPISEANKVIYMCGPQEVNPPTLAPTNHYTFDGWEDYIDPASIGWVRANFPQWKTVYAWQTDNLTGHASQVLMQKELQAEGFTYLGYQFIDPTATDASSLGLKIAQSGADCYLVNGGGPALDGIVLKGVYQAGYKGGKFGTRWFTAITENALAGQAADEGLINAAWPCEFDPATTVIAAQFKKDYITLKGSWDGPEIQGEAGYEIIRAALMKAGTLDTDAVANVIASGLTCEGPQGPIQMIARPDLGNTKTIDNVCGYPMKKITGGNPVQIGAVTLQDAIKYIQLVFH